MYDLCVIGAGLIGSAAARHASTISSVCLVGPGEPKERSLKNDRDIFGCHYDEGRITRRISTDPVWAHLAKQSIARYRQLETASRVQFYNEIGCLMVGEQNSDFLNQVSRVIKEEKIETEYLNSKTLKERFPYLNFSNCDAAIFEPKDAGYISPRNLVSAQIKQMSSNGGRFIEEVANDVVRVVRNGEYCMEITTASNVKILARKVLLATGAFTGFRNLLPGDLDLDTRLMPLTVAKVEITESEFRKIRTMPSTIYSGKGTEDWTREFPRIDSTYSWYMLPPVKYPDGKYYIKLGHFHDACHYSLTTGKSVKEWFCQGGDQNIVNSTAELVQNIVKGVKGISFHGDWCVITETSTDRPYIDTIHSQLGVAVGGNGYAAKSSDEIGRIAAMMMLKNKWDSSIPKEVFNLKFKKHCSKL